MANNPAPGSPGIEPKWTTSDKSGVGTSFGPNSHVWFTLSHGILNEIYYPRVDMACTRDMGLIVTDGENFFSEEKRNTHSKVDHLSRGIPAYRLTNTDHEGRYIIEKEIITDPTRDTVLQRTVFTPLRGALSDYHVYALLAPHLGNQGRDNNAWVGTYKGTPMLFAERDGYALALACSTGWRKQSVGYVGVSDGWQDLYRHKHMDWTYDEACAGNIALTGEIKLPEDGGPFILAIGFGTNTDEAGQRARASLFLDFDDILSEYIKQWQVWAEKLHPVHKIELDEEELYRLSAAVLLCHEAKHFTGGLIASLSIPWGEAKSDYDLGGYHLVWPRDLVEAVGGLIAAGCESDTLRVLDYLQVVQDQDGHWPQNMWLDGRAYWSGIQLDETAFPLILVDTARRRGMITSKDQQRYWPMVRKAAAFLVQNGPVTQEDRWEEDPGYSPFTLAVMIAGLLCAADLADEQGEKDVAVYLRETADEWNACIETWIYVKDTGLAKQVGVEGYYIRLAGPDESEAPSPAQGYVAIKNRPPGENEKPAAQIVSPDALALVRFGLRQANDPRILNTVQVIDALLKVDFPAGPAWHRYNDDGYGEHADGSPFDGTGIGRAWPLLTGERAHYELAAGHSQEARQLLRTLCNFSNEGGMIPEQLWDAPDIPERELFFGKPSGSAMPLVWAHAEYIKLCRSIEEGNIFDMPPQTVQRYLSDHQGSRLSIWKFNQKIRRMPAGKILRVEANSPFMLHWSSDNWKTAQDHTSRDTGLGVHGVDLPTGRLLADSWVIFTFFWTETKCWEQVDHTVQIYS